MRDILEVGGLILVLAALAAALAYIIVVALNGAGVIQSAFEQRDAIVRECLESEAYTRDECLVLASGD